MTSRAIETAHTRGAQKATLIRFNSRANEKGGFQDFKIKSSKGKGLTFEQNIKRDKKFGTFPHKLHKDGDVTFKNDHGIAEDAILGNEAEGGYGQYCIPKDEVLLGDNKSIEDYKVGDSVFGKTGLQSVEQKHEFSYSGDMYEIKAVGCVPFMVTPNHPILVKSTSGASNHKNTWRNGGITFIDESWKIPEELVIKKGNLNGDYVMIPRIKGTISITKIDITSFDNELGKSNIWCRKCGKKHKGLNSQDSRTSLPDIIPKTHSHLTVFPINNDTAWLLGLYIAEGHTNHANGSITLTLDREEMDIALRANQIIENHLNASCRIISHGENGIRVIFSSKCLVNAFDKWCGKGAHNKQLPDFILCNSNTEILSSCLEGYQMGDGSFNVIKDKVYVTAGTVSKILALQLQLAFARFGLFYQISWVNPQISYIRGRQVYGTGRWSLQCNIDKQDDYHYFVKDDYILCPIHSVNIKSFNGVVMSPTTSDHTFLVSNLITHNSGIIAFHPISKAYKQSHNYELKRGHHRHTRDVLHTKGR